MLSHQEIQVIGMNMQGIGVKLYGSLLCTVLLDQIMERFDHFTVTVEMEWQRSTRKQAVALDEYFKDFDSDHFILIGQLPAIFIEKLLEYSRQVFRLFICQA